MAVVEPVTEKHFYVIVFWDVFFSKTLTLEPSSNGKSYLGDLRAVQTTAFQISLLQMHRTGCCVVDFFFPLETCSTLSLTNFFASFYVCSSFEI